MTRRVHRARCGFTLVEMVSTIVILAVIGSSSSYLIFNAADGYVEAAVRAQLHCELAVAQDRFQREIRKVILDSAAAGIAPHVTNASAGSFTWKDEEDDVYAVLLVGDELWLRLNGGAFGTLLDDVTAFTVQCYDESNAALAATLSGAACDPIRRVELTTTMQRQGVSETLRTKVFIRSTMTGGSS